MVPLIFVALSDTHSRHHEIKLPKGDVLLHAGDVTARGQRDEFLDFVKWFGRQPFRHKIFVAGNHDFFLEKTGAARVQQLLPEGMHYLNDSGITIESLQIWGSPVTPWHHQLAFNRRRGADLHKHWQLVPTDTDLLLTHGPPFGILDTLINGRHNGDKDLLQCIKKIKPRIHVCGHIHEAHGATQVGETKFFNCSMLNESNELVNRPFVFSLKQKDNFSLPASP